MTETKWILQRISNNEHESHTIRPGITTVGRGESNLIQCTSLMVSRYQCVFILKPSGNLYLRDLGSSNGTFINVEKSLTNRDVPLMEDDIIGLGVDDVDTNTDEDACFFKLCKVLVQINEKQERRGASSFSSTTVPKEEIIKVNPQEGAPLETNNSTVIGSKRQATTKLSECPSKILKLSNDLSLQKMGEETDIPSVNYKNLTSEHLVIKKCEVPTKITDEIDVIMISDSDDDFDDIIRVLKDVEVSDKEFQSIQDSNKSNDNHLGTNQKVVASDGEINKQTDTFESRMNGEMCLGDYNSTPSSSKYNLSKDCITISTDNTSKVCTSVSTSIEKLKSPMQNNTNNTCDISNTCVNEEHKLLPEKYNGNTELLGSSKNVSTFESDKAVPDSLRNGECKKDSVSNTEQNCKKYSNRSKEENLKKKSNTVVENTITENTVSQKTESNLIKIMPENTNSNKDLDINLLQTVKKSFDNSIELENNLINGGKLVNDCEVVIKEEESISQNTSYTLVENIILIESDDEMPHSQMFDDPDILSEEKDKEMIDDRMSDDDEYNMVMDVGDLDDNDESEEDEWFQKLSQQFIDKEDERQESTISKERSLEEEDADSSLEKLDSELDKDSGVDCNKEEDYTCTKTNDVVETVKSYDEMNRDRAFDLNKDEDSGKSKSYEKNEDLLSSHRKRKMYSKKNNLQMTSMEVAETREEEDFVKATTMDISDTREKEDSVKSTTMEVTESKEDNDSIQGTIVNKEVVKPGEDFNTKSRTSHDVKEKVKSKTHLKKRFSHVKHKKDIEVENKSKSKSKNEKELLQTTSNKFVDNDEDDPIKYAAKLLEHLADSEKKKLTTVSTSVSEVNKIQEDIKKLAVPHKKTMSIDALPQKPRTSKVNQRTLSTKQCHKSIKNTNSNKKTLNPIKGDLPSDSLNKKNVVQMRKMKLKELTEKNKPPVSPETKAPKPSISKNVKLTIKNRSALLVDAFVNEQKHVNHKSSNILTDYKIPRRTSTEQSDDYKKVEQDPKVTILEPSLDIVTQSNSTLEPSFKKPLRRKSSAEQNEKSQVQKPKNDLNEKFPGNTMDKLKPKSFNNNCVRPILKNYSNNVMIQKQCYDNGKKRVQFENDKNLVRTRFIPFLENSMRRPVKKDAPPPPNIVRKLQQQTNTSQNSFDYSDETIYDICKWNPLWIEEQKRHPANEPPPVCPEPIFGCTDVYANYQDYRRTMYPLILRELWANVTRASDQRRKVVYNIAIDHDRYRTPKEFKVKSPTVSPEEQTKTLIHINCQTLLDDEDFRKNIYPRFGDLVVAEVSQYATVSVNEEPKHFGLTLFGYICKATPNKITQYTTHVRPELSAKYPDAKTVLDMVLLVRGPISTLDHKRLGRIRILKSIRADLRVFRALDKLQESPLLPQILNPSFNRFTQNDPMDLQELVSYENAPVLNEAQKKAVLITAKLCLEDSDKERIHLIHGPPGTGKSQVIISLIMQLWMNLYQNTKEQPRILLCAPSNAAIDELVLRLMEIRTKLSGRKKFRLLRNGRIESTHPAVQCLTLDTLRARDVKKSIEMLEDVDYRKVEIDNLTAKINSLSLSLESLKETKYVHSLEEKRKKEEIIEKKLTEVIRRKNEFINQIENKKIDHNTIKKMHADAETKLLECANIVASTLASCYNTQMEKAFNTVIDNKRFTCCIIDEATQATEPDILIPLLLRVNNVVLVGDPKQLPATVIDVVAKQFGLNNSLFSRHRMWWYRYEKTWNTKNMLLHFLDRQYRMHPAIAQWPSDYFYNRLLKTDENMEPLRSSPFLPYVILTHDHNQDKEGEINIGETLIIQNIVWTICNTERSKDYTIGIITPYNRQRFSLAKTFSDLTNTQVEVGTVDSFQGREKDIIIFSCVRTDGVGFLTDMQRLNVALTRAKMSLIICGNFKSLQHDTTWSVLLMNATIRNVIKPVPSSMCLYTRNPNFIDLIRR